MWSAWELTDSDCCQHIRKNGTKFEMIQAVWLDTTSQDKANGLHEYCIVNGAVDLNDYSEDEIEGYLSAYQFTDEPDDWLTAECILEDELLSDSCVIGDADSFEEAKGFVEKYIKEES